jgi:hypothetical protein
MVENHAPCCHKDHAIECVRLQTGDLRVTYRKRIAKLALQALIGRILISIDDALGETAELQQQLQLRIWRPSVKRIPRSDVEWQIIYAGINEWCRDKGLHKLLLRGASGTQEFVPEHHRQCQSRA